MIFKDEGKFVGGLVGDGLDSVSQSITDGILNAFVAILEYILVFAYWGCRIGIMVCLLTYICSKDNKAISLGIKLAFLYLITAMIGGMI